jgi:hypothetical protein
MKSMDPENECHPSTGSHGQPFDKLRTGLGTGRTIQAQGAFSDAMCDIAVDREPLSTLFESGCILHKNDGNALLFSIQMGVHICLIHVSKV